jgi:LacI family transcriptional regulator
MTKKPTISNVAERAGVAVSTVSRFLNGRYVSPEVRERLARIIDELGYTPSWTARNLSLGRRGSIGVVVDSSEDPWFVLLLSGIQEELAARDVSLMLASLELQDQYDPGRVAEWIRDRRVDGLILAKSQRRERALIRAAVEARLPAVAVVPDEALQDVQVLHLENVEAGIGIARHLAELGHSRVGFVSGPEHSLDSKHRLRGVRDGLAQQGLRLADHHVFTCEQWDIAAGIAFGRKFLSGKLPVTALVLANDALALGFLRVAHERNIPVPEMLSVAGFDGLPAGEIAWPSLTTMAQPVREMGRVACRRLFEAIDEPGRLERIQFRMELVVRESTGPAGKAPRPAPRR